MKYYSMYMKEVGTSATIDLAQVDLQEEFEVELEGEKQRKIDKNELRLRQELLDTQAKFNALTSSLQTRPAILESPSPELRITPLP